MLLSLRATVVRSFLGLTLLLSACGELKYSESEVQTVVGRGGAFFDRRVQVINALPDTLNQTTCLYLSEFKKSEAIVFNGENPLNEAQKLFLERAERQSKSVTQYPVSILELDRLLQEKESLRRMRGALIIPFGVGASFIGFGIVAAAMAPLCPGCFWGGMSIGQVLTNPVTLGFLGFGLGGLGLLSQAYRDLHSKNKGIRAADAVASSINPPVSTHLGVTLALVNAARSLSAASDRPCPQDLTHASLQQHFTNLAEQHRALSASAREQKISAALERLQSSPGCYFSTEHSGDRLIYKAHELDDNAQNLRLQAFRVQPERGAQLVFDDELRLQLTSDTGMGRKYVHDSAQGSIALWVENSRSGHKSSSRLAHKLSSGEYVGAQASILGRCQL